MPDCGNCRRPLGWNRRHRKDNGKCEECDPPKDKAERDAVLQSDEECLSWYGSKEGHGA